MIDLAEARRIVDDAANWSTGPDGWGYSSLKYRPPGTAEPHFVRRLDDRNPADRLFAWSLDHLSEVVDELEAIRGDHRA